ncbi:hypothetical protein EJ066_26220 [Mesorhizobium sp. M9A.F.Ca.ET.002.03.1.2]|uniref:hypothetical protein n=1 Tax=Mesorhizobium sp. M9A.F.Ca.ET.002.03.1.2 TaxID=2493668 RepID=UPI000F764056|nr:hypothetical protein [Mesorhizobium sp. M9A.F.Ca.ET.002.03.1.2]AZO00340.1 hypothetical protein EJ066_26220 [Mesorhizobium sp. M9A.F.Ca.ET.002.03.1.2]
MKKLHPGAAAALLAVLVGIALRRNGYSSHGPIDTALFVVFLVFFWWLISDFSGGKASVDADGHQSANTGIAFRFGRFLSRIFRGNRGL